MSVDRLLAKHAARARELQAAADGYVALGWHLFPCYRKRPLTEHGFYDATTQIGTWGLHEIGIACGASGLVVLDIDPRNGGDESLRALEARHGPLPVTPRVLTGGGGTHYYYAGLVPGRKVADGVDLQGVGKYVVAPPSSHPSGKHYTWDAGAHIDDVPIAPAPMWLVVPEVKRTSPRPAREYVPAAYARAALERGWNDIAGASNGARNILLNKVTYGWAKHLRQVPDAQLEAIALDAARAADLPEREALRTIASAIRSGRRA